jgi:hypothetical protein
MCMCDRGCRSVPAWYGARDTSTQGRARTRDVDARPVKVKRAERYGLRVETTMGVTFTGVPALAPGVPEPWPGVAAPQVEMVKVCE